ncbi:MAG: hypothetical protein A3J69_00360 [Candidatus Levybacteria bacterium RIFCSPHIGHO2_02_FULL_42_12]|nr:MAG: hypothetical protein A3J69_00360 [Candidatus Levybacteria bacterium RIFCSPHIGHO2_02_FULL_42_12]OGH42943.1 MAG: hypothetical protein A3B53_03490 [Candidatus Levybacteria bacterium RIFCSPLOWO2_01_FULL_42_15]
MIRIIVAMDEKRGIGKNNDLLFRIPEDLKRFKQLTSDHPIIMGRKTFESIGRVLPNRTNIIITRDFSYKAEGAVIVHSLEEGIAKAKEILSSIQNDKKKEIFVIGGGQIFATALPLADRLYLTLVKGDYNADTFFPDYSAFKTTLSKEKHQYGSYMFEFLTLER